MAQPDTIARILDAAEELFAEKGFSDTSLRSITGLAEVNLAAVNYHFGSKKGLIQAVFSRYLDPFCESLNRQIDAYEQSGQPRDVEAILRLMVVAAEDGPTNDANKSAIILRLLGVAYTQGQGHLKKYLQETYGQVFRRFLGLFRDLVPGVSATDMYWRIHFSLGTTVFTMSGLQALMAIYERDYQKPITVNDVIDQLIPFIAAGLNASPSQQNEKRLIS